ncbi:MAG: metal-binding protein [Cyanobacteria bacterium J069]|nr:MAG: metal-binding protein [Cyanobacteria bacterium J069]
MPSGRTHDRITLWTLPVVGGLALGLTRSSSSTLILCAGFLVGGLLFGPDLDIHSVHYKRWGWFRWIWIPYRGSLKHRSPLSHAPITGTVLRILYLLAWVGVASFFGLALLNEIWRLGWTWGEIGGVMGRSLQTHAWAWLTFCAGLELGALSHYIADYVVSSRKRFKTQGWRAFLPKPSKPSKSRRRTTTARKKRS